MFLKINENSQKNTCAGVSFNKVAAFQPATLLKETPELYKIFKNIYFVEHVRTPASVSHLATSAYAKH